MRAAQERLPMKLFAIKMIFLLVMLGFVAPMFIRGPDGKPIMSMDDWIPHSAIAWTTKSYHRISNWFDELGSPTVIQSQDGDVIPSITGAGAEIYSWRDENGVLHFSDTPVSGAQSLTVPDDGLEIPADRFVQSGLAPAEPKRSSASGGVQAILLKEREGRKVDGSSAGAASLGDVDALANGDLSSAGKVMGNLPELMEQLKEARHAVRDGDQ